MFSKEEIIKEFKLEQLSPQAQNVQVEQIREIIQTRLGEKLGESLTHEQLQTLNDYIEKGQDAEAGELLEKTFPDYKDLVSRELADLRDEIDGTVSKWMS